MINAVGMAKDKFGKLDVTVNCAGIVVLISRCYSDIK